MTKRDNRRGPSHPHDERLQFGWKIVRYGMSKVSKTRTRGRVLEWIAAMKPSFPGSPFLSEWERIVRGEDERARGEVEKHPTFFDLPPRRRGYWRQLVQSQPFTVIVPGKTADERRAVLSRHP
jgi:hypothetical protein